MEGPREARFNEIFGLAIDDSEGVPGPHSIYIGMLGGLDIVSTA